MPGRGTPITPEQRAQILECAARGMGWAEIAHITGRHRGTVRSVVIASKRPSRSSSFSAGELAAIKRLATNGETSHAIGKALQRAPTAVWARMRKLGFVKRSTVLAEHEYPEKTWAILSARAARRHLRPEMLAVMIIDSVVRRYPVDDVIRGWQPQHVMAAGANRRRAPNGSSGMNAGSLPPL